MAKIEIELPDYVNAKDGSLLIKKNGKWVITNFDELNKVNEQKLKKVDDLEIDFNALARNNKHFVTYAKSHFLVVFNYFKIKVLSGEIDVVDENIMRLDEEVLNGSLSVEEAIEKHELLKETFTKLYLTKKEMKEFPEV